MKKLYTLLLWGLLSPLLSISQPLTLGTCYELARENYPLVQRYGLIAQSEQYDLRHASSSYLPQISISGKASYQTDVTTIPLSLPGIDIPTISKDQYQIAAEVSQTIWDGGATRAARKTIEAQGEVDRAQYEVDMYALRERIDNLYFGILLLDEQLRINTLFLNDLEVTLRRLSSYMENGVANQADLDLVLVEQLGAKQARTQLEANRKAYLTMLSAFVGQPLDADTRLEKPSPESDPRIGSAELRPEMALFNAMQQQLEERRKSIRSTTMPRIGLFVQGGYGRPGLNMLENDFKPFAIAGVRLSWNFGGFYTRRSDMRKIDVGLQQIEINREVFLFNNNLRQLQLDAQYRKYRDIMQDDEQIILLRENIVRSSEARLANGTIDVSDLMRDLIAVQNARANKAVHEIEMLQTIYGIKNLTNN
ncbi:MAG TPA: TolC family protein [Candidatus Alistipes avicola]|uniref:TolC family protein n=1 Tax=Candidatus Alistipes avicola TaxID=2838432 RepID=A0A9D2L4E3_9BACT|nr:TolC family protein [uncultured Alistipes sp.]HJA99070.1 TolC family protein [Candidatus Alistipes avicola]